MSERSEAWERADDVLGALSYQQQYACVGKTEVDEASALCDWFEELVTQVYGPRPGLSSGPPG